MTYVKLVWAEAAGGAIGKDGEMPWYLPEDLAHFKAETLGLPVVMGRRTWESLPERFRPLPERLNVVVTRDSSYVASGAIVRPSLETALLAAKDSAGNTVCIIGGGELYRDALPIADELVVTRIELQVPDADTFAPEISADWSIAESSDTRTSDSGLNYHFERYLRAAP